MNRLQSIREIEGLSQAQLGQQLGLSAQMVSAIEKGSRPFAGDLTILGYSEDRLNIPDMSEPLHRSRASTKVAARKRAKELLRLAGEVFEELRRKTDGAPVLALRRGEPFMDVGDIDDFARDLRHALMVEESGPIRNLTAVAERAGACIVPISVEGVDGLSAWVDDVPVIGLNPTVPGDRFRLTLAHELAHLLHHRKTTEASESEANLFASTLLFPADEFDDLVPGSLQLRDFVNLKSSWGVSVAALVYRAHEIGYIDDRRYRSLQIQMSKWRRNEPASFVPVYGELMNRLIAVNGGSRQVAMDLGVSKRHLDELSKWHNLRIA